MPTLFRKPIALAVERQLGNFFGFNKRCVVTRKEQGQYHHLDDDASNSVFENLIPIDGSLNSPRLRDARARTGRNENIALPAILAPDNLILTAKNRFNESWNAPQSYGCARLAYYIGKNYQDAPREISIRRACDALYYARHSTSYALMEDIIRRDILPNAQSKLEGRERAAILQEVAGIYGDAGWAPQAAEIYQVLQSSRDLPRPDDAASYAGLLRREAMSILVNNGGFSRAEDLFQEARRIMGKNSNLRVGVANSLVWSYIIQENYSGALDALGEFPDLYSKVIFNKSDHRGVREILKMGSDEITVADITFWNAAELFLNAFVCLSSLRKYDKAENSLAKAIKLFESYKARPFQLKNNQLIYGEMLKFAHSKDLIIPMREPLPRQFTKLLASLVAQTIRT